MRGSERLGSKSESRYESRIAVVGVATARMNLSVWGLACISEGFGSTLTEYICPAVKELCVAVKSLRDCRKQVP